MRNDGFALSVSTGMFTPATLRAADILVIVNAGSSNTSRAARSTEPAFTAAECDAVRDWVRSGGALLLIAVHAPYGSAAAALAERFGVDFGEGWVSDSSHALTSNAPTVLVFSDALIGSSPILDGRDQSERVRRVVAFTGQSMSVPPDGTTLLRLSDSAVEYLVAGQKMLAMNIPLIEDHRETTIHLAQPVANAQ